MEQISHDPMTGLKDRITFFRQLNRHRQNAEPVHIIVVQLTRLILVNRKYGIDVGDQLLREIAHFLDSIDENYSAYRIANSRFILLGPPCGLEKATETAQRIYQRFEENWKVSCKNQLNTIHTTAHVVHLFLSPEDTENELLEKLNYALSVLAEHHAKGFLLFDESVLHDMQHYKYVLEEVRYAIEHKTFQMYYQPIYNCREKKFTSAESLIRLFGRDGTFISPGEFIPMAEENGLIDPISWIVLEKVCRFLGSHPGLPLTTASVNLTGEQILDPTFIERIENLLETSHLDGHHLRIEITERTFTEDFDEVKKVMQYLETKGVRFYLDDFGTGYSNLSSMLSLPFEVVKFDQSLIHIMNTTPEGRHTIDLLAQIMHEHNYVIVAEGIETQSQAEAAHEKELDRIQGYFYAKPLSEEALVEFLNQTT